MASKPRLKGVSPELIKPRKPKILIYGPSGVGKTTWALDFPDVFFIDVEGGATQPEYSAKLRKSGGLYLGPDEGAASFDEVMGEVKALCTERHDRKTLVIDSMTKLFANEIAREGDRLSEAGKKNEFGADKRPAVAYMRQLVNWLTKINMNVILVCGEVAEWGMDSKGERIQVGQVFDCWPRLEYELDLAVQVVRQGSTRLGKIRKSRIAAFPQSSTFPWSYDEFSSRYGRDVVEEASEPVALATEEQLVEINRLLGIVKLDEGTVDRWLAAANASSWEEMEGAKVAKAIDHLKGKLAA